MLPVRTLKLSAVALLGALGSGYALNLLNEGTPAGGGQADAQAALGPALARPSARDADSPFQAGLTVGSLTSSASIAADVAAGGRLLGAHAGADQIAPSHPGPARVLTLRPAPGAADTAAPSDAGGDLATDAGIDPCAPALSLDAGPAATIMLRLHAPCHANARVEFRHATLRFAERIPVDGMLEALIPALTDLADVAVRIEGAAALRASLELPEAAFHRRVALQWTGEGDFVLHALHDGAGLGDAGDLHHLRPSDPSLPGALTFVLGDPSLEAPMRAHVHSVPLLQADSVRFAVAATVSDGSCGQTLRAEVLGAQTAGTAARLAVDMPACADLPAGFVLMPVPVAQDFARR